MMGHLGMKDWQQVGLIVPFFIIGTTILLIKSKELNALTMGDNSALQLGVNVKKEKFLILLAVGLLTGSSVAVSGMIGFVGLIIPHFIRLLVGSNHKHVLPISILIGSSYLTFADIIARTIIDPKELPIGVITAIIGAPVFTWLLIRQRSKGGHRNA
jgi:iron complex transport system permease protein